MNSPQTRGLRHADPDLRIRCLGARAAIVSPLFASPLNAWELRGGEPGRSGRATR